MHVRSKWLSRGVLGVAIILGACRGGEREATEAAINAAQTAINTVAGEAAKYVPEQLSAAQNAVKTAREALAKGDYDSALAAARDASNKAKELAGAAAAKKEEWAATWASVSATTPRTLDQVKSRLDAYSHGAKWPPGLDAEQLAAAKDQYAALKQNWTDALAAQRQGNLADAATRAAALKEALAKLAESLGIKT